MPDLRLAMLDAGEDTGAGAVSAWAELQANFFKDPPPQEPTKPTTAPSTKAKAKGKAKGKATTQGVKKKTKL
eukprot:3066952-Lingulodinium_polyedra.AAC.1